MQGDSGLNTNPRQARLAAPTQRALDARPHRRGPAWTRSARAITFGMASPDPDPNPADIQIGYQAAVALWIYEGNLIWSKFNALLVANSIVLAVFGLSLGSSRLPQPFTIGLPIAGIILCAAWAILTKRGFD